MQRRKRGLRIAAEAALASVLAVLAAGCGTPGAPQPPSLRLPQRVADLAAVRTGDQVTLTWTMPQRNTDKLLLKGPVDVYICRAEAAEPCVEAGHDQMLAPGSNASYVDALPQPLTQGTPRLLCYTVELKNHSGRSAGPSSAAMVLAGEAPPAIDQLNAEVHPDGVELAWSPAGSDVPVRLVRTLLTPPKAHAKPGSLTPSAEPREVSLLVDSETAGGRALDKTARFGETYTYRAQRVARVTADGQTLELAGALSPPVTVNVADVFPPAVPRGLVAVATAPENGVAAFIDLSWRPNIEPDLAGYAVYRREDSSAWQRISPAAPIAGPAFHDAHVQPGENYHYAVTAIDQSGRESARSAEAEETVPAP
ncbi:MAG TPA: hypothetical protein VFU55_13420 [Terracidiphilus sp.]|nr:hypothetical protein [Terracidiphilus sp.]